MVMITPVSSDQGSICEIPGAGVGFWGIKTKAPEGIVYDCVKTTPAEFLDGIYSQGR